MLLYYCIVQINYLVDFHLQLLEICLSLDVDKSSVDKLTHSDKDSADDQLIIFAF